MTELDCTEEERDYLRTPWYWGPIGCSFYGPPPYDAGCRKCGWRPCAIAVLPGHEHVKAEVFPWRA